MTGLKLNTGTGELYREPLVRFFDMIMTEKEFFKQTGIRPQEKGMYDLPMYKCHKVVSAAKIEGMNDEVINGTLLYFEGFDNGCGFYVPDDWVEKHDPQIDGYLVIYEGGYMSYSPEKAFEEGYSEIVDAGEQVAAMGTLSDRNTPITDKMYPMSEEKIG